MARLEVKFNRVYFRDGANLLVPTVRFSASLTTGPMTTYLMRDNKDHEGPNHLHQEKRRHLVVFGTHWWSKIFDQDDGSSITVKFTATTTNLCNAYIGGGALTQLQGFERQLDPPYRTKHFLQDMGQYVLDWEVVRLDPPYGRVLPDNVDALRLHRQHKGLSTIAGGPPEPIVEFHPIVPVPEIGSLKGPMMHRWKRGMRSRLTRDVEWNPDLRYPIEFDEDSEEPVFPNPAAIPIPEDLEFVADKECARIEFTRYAPRSMGFADNDARLKWSCRRLDAGGDISFFQGKKQGLKVLVYGTQEGEVELRVRYCQDPSTDVGPYVGWYRALVKPMRKIPYRVNILEGPNRSDKPRCTVQDIEKHVKIANMFLRQMAVELELDQDRGVYEHIGADPLAAIHQQVIGSAPYNIRTDPHDAAKTVGVRPQGRDGIFRINVPRGYTKNVCPQRGQHPGIFLNYKRNVLNIVYVKRIEPFLRTTVKVLSLGMRSKGGIGKEGTSGLAVAWPGNNAGSLIHDVPPPDCLSWGLPYGRLYGAVPKVQTMKLGGEKLNGVHNECSALWLSDFMGNPARSGSPRPFCRGGYLKYGHTLAHEVAHCLNLEHRIDRSDKKNADGFKYPRLENVMYYIGWSMTQDFDIIQAKAVHQSPLVHD